MFLPGEMLYHAALQQDPTLVESLANERVLLATPTTLIGLLRVLVTARKFETLEVAPPGSELPALEPVETRPRQLQAAELLGREPTVAAVRIS